MTVPAPASDTEPLRPLLGRIWRDYLSRHKPAFFASMLFAAISGGLTALLLKFLEPAIDLLFTRHEGPVKVWGLVTIPADRVLILIPLFIIVVAVIRSLAMAAQSALVNRLGHGIVGDIQKQLFSGMIRADLSRLRGQHSGSFVSSVLFDANLVREAFTNAHWLGPDLVRTNQPSPEQLSYWQRRGVRTVINLRGQRDEAYYWLEKDACARLGLTLIDAPLDSRDPPDRDRIDRARDLFRTIEYPALIHCKSGADRAGMMAVLYRHFHLGEPISAAMTELGKRTLHSREGLTGVLDYTLEKYVDEVEPTGVSFEDWVASDAYDPKAIRAGFKAGWWGKLVVDRLLKRE